ncbi:ubiquinone/menaquinone biosynthesis C-methylase UbiE [Catenuloplanes nepalensis]|uniref:Ubiquinone/menaquinone biosynthesis C-methylase UbiE n=1 Tax=Catenuloplanes nepalensis TaxID=587533 RepID=A0ABT9MYV6_9ACTN|nr:class I SAM-dependent methyltransferase [Catenuloplanes nepalensis]MDP9796615.1 ubiquinone/menaquinone biosynthesis C-methylase UbiE [Catenuloplanes nepalensis]
MTKSKLSPEMEGSAARRYARIRGTESQLAMWRADAERLAAQGGGILEIAPGPGYLTVELAKRGAQVSALDISHTFAAMVRERAEAESLTVDARQGDAAAMPFADESFDLIICQAAFKNFLRPVEALDEMHRVLRPGGVALIEDLDPRATRAKIAAEVAGMRLDKGNALFTRIVLGWLRRRAHTPEQLTAKAGKSRFTNIHIERYGTIGLRLTLKKETA